MASLETCFDIPNRQRYSMIGKVLAPLDKNLFLAEYWGKSFVRVTGRKDKLQWLLPWSELNTILETQRLEPPRFRMFMSGKPVDRNRYMTSAGETPSRLNSAGFINCLSDGATMVLDDIDELAPSVRELAQEFEDAFRVYTSVNLYAGWRTQNGFDLHWDDQDTMILQLSGRKRWTVYRPTRLHPLRKDTEQAPKPSDEPIWEGVLEDGDLIYMPRGWWHVAYPIGEPSLHLTVTIVQSHGAELLHWYVNQLKRHPEVRMDLPNLANKAERAQYFAKLRDVLWSDWSDDLLDRFLTFRDSKLPLRPHVRLPFAPLQRMSGPAAIGMETRVRLATVRRLAFESAAEDGTATVRVNDKGWSCGADLVPVLESLSSNSSRSLRELCEMLPSGSAASRLKMFLTALVMAGVLWAESPEEEGRP
jgi:hypothetical protein